MPALRHVAGTSTGPLSVSVLAERVLAAEDPGVPGDPPLRQTRLPGAPD